MLLQGFEASISVKDGASYTKLDEYKPVIDGDKRASAHICSVDSANFSIDVKRAVQGQKRNVMVETWLDGRKIHGVWTFPASEPSKIWFDGIWLNKNEFAPFVFSRVEEVESSGSSSSTAGRLGTIEVKLYAIKNVRKVPRTYFGEGHETAKVDEKALKERKKEDAVPLSHRVSLDDRVLRVLRSKFQHTYERVGTEPLAHFTFSYASRAVLEASSIVPTTTPAPAPPIDADLTQELQASNDELRRKLARMERRLNMLERGRLDESGDGPVVIDLTGDVAAIGTSARRSTARIKGEGDDEVIDVDDPRPSKRIKTDPA